MALVGVAALECTIGLCLISGRAMRPAIYLLAIELVGILSPVVLLPSRIFSGPHHAPTLEGQYVLKDVIVVAATLVLATTLRGAKITSQPNHASPRQDCTTGSAHDCVAEHDQLIGSSQNPEGFMARGSAPASDAASLINSPCCIAATNVCAIDGHAIRTRSSTSLIPSGCGDHRENSS
jgi:hypothetical protein